MCTCIKKKKLLANLDVVLSDSDVSIVLDFGTEFAPMPGKQRQGAQWKE